jgi:hypothetical protein
MNMRAEIELRIFTDGVDGYAKCVTFIDNFTWNPTDDEGVGPVPAKNVIMSTLENHLGIAFKKMKKAQEEKDK